MLVALATASILALGVALESARGEHGGSLYRRHVVEGGRVTVDLPVRWPTLRPQDARFPGTAPTLAARRPDLLPLLAGLAQPDSGLRLLAFDPRSKGAVTANLLLRLEQAREVSYGRWTRGVVAGVRRAPGLVGPVRARTVRVQAGRALRVDYARTPRGAPGPVALTQLWVSRGATTVTLSFAVATGQRARYEPTLARVLRSVALGP